MIRRLVVAVALVAIVRAAPASHHHPLFATDSEMGSEEIVTRHDPSSLASHLHAILRILPPEACWACKWSRASGLPESSHAWNPCVVGRALNALPARSALSIARFTRLSRGPPALSSL